MTIAINRYRGLVLSSIYATSLVVDSAPDRKSAVDRLVEIVIDAWLDEGIEDRWVEIFKCLDDKAVNFSAMMGEFPNAMDSAILLSLMLVNAGERGLEIDPEYLYMLCAIFITALLKESGMEKIDFFNLVDPPTAESLAANFPDFLAHHEARN
jgi:hypothetical protein